MAEKVVKPEVSAEDKVKKLEKKIKKMEKKAEE